MTDSNHIFFGFRRKPEHEIQLESSPSSFECPGCCKQDVFFGDNFVDRHLQAMGSRFRSKRDTTAPAARQRLHQVKRLFIDPQTGQ